MDNALAFDLPLGYVSNNHFTWEILNDTLYLDFEDRSEISRYTFDIEDDILTLINLDSAVESTYRFSMTILEFPDFLETILYDRPDIGEVTVDGLDGRWVWDFDNDFQLIFNDDGTGAWLGVDAEFIWEVSDDELTMIIDESPERWIFEINGRELTISNIDRPEIEYIYHSRR